MSVKDIHIKPSNWWALFAAHASITVGSIQIPNLDYFSSVWTPYKKGNIEALEKVQKKGNKDTACIETSFIER